MYPTFDSGTCHVRENLNERKSQFHNISRAMVSGKNVENSGESFGYLKIIFLKIKEK